MCMLRSHHVSALFNDYDTEGETFYACRYVTGDDPECQITSEIFVFRKEPVTNASRLSISTYESSSWLQGIFIPDAIAQL
jgi:hypothetical protein